MHKKNLRKIAKTAKKMLASPKGVCYNMYLLIPCSGKVRAISPGGGGADNA